MKRKLFGGFLATVLALSSICGCVFAAQNSETITGSGSVIAAEEVFDVIIPANLNYAVDVEGILKADSTTAINVDDSAIYSGSFGVVNHSSTSIKVDVAVSAADADKVTVETADTIAANNAKTSADIATISTAPAINLAIAPVTEGAVTVVTAAAVNGVTRAAVSFDSEDVVTDKALAVSTDAATISFALEAADYEVSKGAISLETTNGGFEVSGDASALERIYKGAEEYVSDPVVGFTIIGDANIYADWSAVDTLPELTAVFTITSLTDVEFGALTFDTAADCLLAGGVANTALACSLQTVANGVGTDITTATTADKGIYISINGALSKEAAANLTEIKLNGTAITPSTTGNSSGNGGAVYFKLPTGTTLASGDVFLITLADVEYTFTVK